MARALTRIVLAVACVALARSARAQCETEAPLATSIHSDYGPDADGDGVPDAITARCPTHLDDAPGPPRDPACYLSQAWVPDAYAFDDMGTLGAFFRDNGCVPAFAYPVDDSALGVGRGVVIVGASRDVASFAASAIAAGAGSWTSAFALGLRPLDSPPPPSQALCLVSFDYGAPAAAAIAVASPSIANFYAHYCPSGACDARPVPSQPWPLEGLGLARSQRIESWQTRRPTLATDTASVERFAFGRGALYAHAFADDRRGCSAAEAVTTELVSIDGYDPTSGPPRFARALKCPDPIGSAAASELPPGLSLLPPELDLALRDDARARADATDGTPACLLEGVPYGLIADLLAGSSRNASSARNGLGDSYLLPNRALLARSTAADAGFVIVPEPIAFLDQNLVLAPRAQSFVVAPLQPEGSAARSAADARQTRRVAQRFAIETGASRTVEARESSTFDSAEWPPRASTFDASEHYGTRWTSNDGAPDCFATTAFTSPHDVWLRFSYPLASGASGVLANDFCPNELNGWLVRTQEERGGAQALCAAADRASATNKGPILEAVSTCLARSDKPDAGAATAPEMQAASDADACLQSGCNPLAPGSCPANPRCASLFEHLIAPTVDLESCIADGVLAGTETLLPASAHWADVRDGDQLRLVSMVGMVRTTDAETEKVAASAASPSLDAGATAAPAPWPTTVSHMTQEDAFFGGAHQTLDWNWIVEPDSVDAIDPSYRGIAVDDGHFISLENELEFGVAAGLWREHVRLPEGHRFNTHGRDDFRAFLQSTDTAEELGEIWPTDFCNAFGIDRHPGGLAQASVPMSSCEPCISCDPNAKPSDAGVEPGCAVGRRYFRTHLGRGIFSPIAAETVLGDNKRETAFMAKESAWPGCASAPQKKLSPDRLLPLGLEDWNACPHRIAYLGRPILDCGHGDNACDPQHRLEIHPPHVLTLELHQKTIAQPDAVCPKSANACASAAPAPGCIVGTVSAAFGWANAMIGRHLEFDIWPPPRPSPDSALCALGHEHDESDPASDAGGITAVENLGFRVVKSPAPALCGGQSDALAPALRCQQLPLSDPNHLHCVYEDPAAEQCDDPDAKVEEGGVSYGNPRMTPRFASSIFEARVFLGWTDDPATCPSCVNDGDACDD